MPAIPADGQKHRCPKCNKPIHAICGVPNPDGDSSITFSQICYTCAEKSQQAAVTNEQQPAVTNEQLPAGISFPELGIQNPPTRREREIAQAEFNPPPVTTPGFREVALQDIDDSMDSPDKEEVTTGGGNVYTRVMLMDKTKKDLKQLCKDNSLMVGGNKNDLCERLLHHFRVGATELRANEVAAPIGHPTQSRWRVLQQVETPIELPNNCGMFYNPTQRDIPTEVVVRRYNFSEAFEREKFNMKSQLYVFDRRGITKVDRHGQPILEEKVRKPGQPKISWLEKNNLSLSSHPMLFMEAILSQQLSSCERITHR